MVPGRRPPPPLNARSRLDEELKTVRQQGRELRPGQEEEEEEEEEERTDRLLPRRSKMDTDGTAVSSVIEVSGAASHGL